MTEGRGTEYQKLYYVILEMSDKGILGPELPPTDDYWHWAILQPDKLPVQLQKYIPLGEVRW